MRSFRGTKKSVSFRQMIKDQIASALPGDWMIRYNKDRNCYEILDPTGEIVIGTINSNIGYSQAHFELFHCLKIKFSKLLAQIEVLEEAENSLLKMTEAEESTPEAEAEAYDTGYNNGYSDGLAEGQHNV